MFKSVFPALLLSVLGLSVLDGPLLNRAIALSNNPVRLVAQQPPRQASAHISFNPPRRGAPPATVGLGSRGDCLENQDERLQVLIPEIHSDLIATGASPLSLTTASHPTLLAYVPAYHDSAQSLRVRVMQVTSEDQEVEVYSQTFELPPTPGVVQLQVNPSLPGLDVGQTYHWYVSIICSAIDHSGNPTVDGWIERTELNPELAAKLAQADRLQQAQLYAQAGLWSDLLVTLTTLHKEQPHQTVWQTTWQNLLQSVGLGAIANAPLLNCCQPLE